MMTVFRVTYFDGNDDRGCFHTKFPDLDIPALLEGMEPGDGSYRIQAVKMTDEELESLPEFEGF